MLFIKIPIVFIFCLEKVNWWTSISFYNLRVLIHTYTPGKNNPLKRLIFNLILRKTNKYNICFKGNWIEHLTNQAMSAITFTLNAKCLNLFNMFWNLITNWIRAINLFVANWFVCNPLPYLSIGQIKAFLA